MNDNILKLDPNQGLDCICKNILVIVDIILKNFFIQTYMQLQQRASMTHSQDRYRTHLP